MTSTLRSNLGWHLFQEFLDIVFNTLTGNNPPALPVIVQEKSDVVAGVINDQLLGKIGVGDSFCPLARHTHL